MAYHDSQAPRRRLELLVIPVVTSVLTSLAIVMRIFARWFLVNNIGIDDWVMVIAWVSSMGLLGETIVGWKHGMGMHSITLQPKDMIAILKDTLAIEITYYITVYIIKVSIILLYLRFATEKGFRRTCKATIAVLTIYAFICIIVLLTQCIPLTKVWDITEALPGTCINRTVFFYITASFNIITDIWVTALPVRTLMSIQRPKREKAGLVLIFAMGAFSCVAAIIRLQTIAIFTFSKDPFFDAVPGDIWSAIEINVAIICASLPSLKPLICYCSRSERTRRSNQSSSGRGYIQHGSGGGGQRNGSKLDPEIASESFPMTPGVKGSVNRTPKDAGSDTESTEHIFAAPDAKSFTEARMDFVKDPRIKRIRDMV
ncbi:hypothetical protein K432DRAFT_327625 [Lepidopterella palustris CBS 459.81]|uniref:Rhodopsin domain-containing protein n=1 Tax=Lepidopterella palustris CBS 459.81 TaxID=1314670 RepID=A0A8E2JFS3_9PEZI|nr:hypothetical protein K432DRAFT_327625 [Lepidopterella palustris CBS 459.81]